MMKLFLYYSTLPKFVFDIHSEGEDRLATNQLGSTDAPTNRGMFFLIENKPFPVRV